MNWRDLVFPPGATKHDWVVDIALCIAMILTTVSPYVPVFRTDLLPHAIISSAMVLPLVIRRHSPLIMMALCAVAGLAQIVFVNEPLASIMAVPIVAYSVARWVPGITARSVLVLGSVGAVLGPAKWTFAEHSVVTGKSLANFGLLSLVCGGLVLTPYAVGRRMRDAEEARTHQLAAADERYRLMLAERDQQTRLAEARARADIARELHDIVAHSLSVMIVQAEGGKALAAKRPETAVDTLDTIAESGREAMNEMRRILGLLRADPHGAEDPVYAPAPTLGEIPDLVSRTSPKFSLIISGQIPDVSPALSLTVYRVIQEAMTNVLKHAGTEASATVTLTYRSSAIDIEVIDDGVGVIDGPSSRGHGIRGMSERVSAMRGRLETGPREEGGFRVFVTLPLDQHKIAS